MSEIKSKPLYVVMCASGQVGGGTARALLQRLMEHQTDAMVRVIVRDAEKGKEWSKRGCQVAIVDHADVSRLAAAFSGAAAAFVMCPPVFDNAIAYIATLHAALVAAKPPPARVVVLSSIGAQESVRVSGIMAWHLLETTMRMAHGVREMVFLRGGNFMSNLKQGGGDARIVNEGIYVSFLQPSTRPHTFVAPEDIGVEIANQMLRTLPSFSDPLPRIPTVSVIEFEGPHRHSPTEAAAIFSKVLGKEVKLVEPPRHSWDAMFSSLSPFNAKLMTNMYDGINQGWITFEAHEKDTMKGRTTLETYAREFVKSLPHAPAKHSTTA